MPIRQLADSDTDLSSVDRGRKYPNPFFDLANDYIPRNIKTLFKYCRTFFYTNGFLHNVITKLTEYPITDLLFMGDLDSATKKKYLELLHRHIKIKSFLIEIGLDYFTYGNSFISFNLKFKRFLVCPVCTTEHQIEHVNYKLKRYEFVGDCPNADCQARGQVMKIHDVYIKSVKNFNLIKWAPENIEIEYNPLSGTSTYYYSMPAKIKNLINMGHKKTLQEVPEIFLQALKQKKKIELDSDNLYHFKRPTLAEDDMGWGKPLILPALKEIYYLQTLRRGNEAIAQEHIVPKKSIFPANTTTLDPYSMAPDTYVKTSNGVKQLKDALKNILVGHLNTPTKIVTHNLREIEPWDYMLNIKSFGLSAIDTKVNSVHPFRVWDKKKGAIRWKKAKHLRLNDYTAYPVNEFQGESSVKQYIETSKYVKWRWRFGTQKLPKNIKLDTNFYKLLGYYIAEGCASKSGLVGFSFHTKEIEYYSFVTKQLNKLLPKTDVNINERNNSCEVRKQSVALADFLNNLVGNGFDKKSLHKVIPDLTSNRALALLNGIYDGDGTFFYERGKYARLNLKLANIGLIFEIRDILLTLGYYPTVVKDDSSVNRAWSLKLNGY